MQEQIDARDSGALLSPCRRWRYLLWRRWDADKPVVMFVGLNPSTADELKDDPTIRRCVNYAKSWGYGSVWMANVFAWRATDPEDMKLVGLGAIGPLNNEYLISAAKAADLVVAAWGTHADFLDRQAHVLRMFAQTSIDVQAFGVTQGGFPKHPLYLKKDLKPVPFNNPTVICS